MNVSDAEVKCGRRASEERDMRLRLLALRPGLLAIAGCGVDPSPEQCRAWADAAKDQALPLRSNFRDVPGIAFDAAVAQAKEREVGHDKIERCRDRGYW